MTKKIYLSPKEYGSQVGLAPCTICRMCRDNEIDGARKMGRSWRIPVEADDKEVRQYFGGSQACVREHPSEAIADANLNREILQGIKMVQELNTKYFELLHTLEKNVTQLRSKDLEEA